MTDPIALVIEDPNAPLKEIRPLRDGETATDEGGNPVIMAGSKIVPTRFLIRDTSQAYTGGGNLIVKEGLNLATLTGEAVPPNATHAIIRAITQGEHATSTVGCKWNSVWMDAYPDGGDFDSPDFSVTLNLFATHAIYQNINFVDAMSPTKLVPIKWGEAYHLGHEYLIQHNSQLTLKYWLDGYILG